MAGMDWFRSWHGAPTDHKWAVVAARSGAKVGVVSAIAWALFDYASQHAERGTVDGFDTETYAVYSGFPEDEVKAVIKAMTDKGIIVNGRLANWEKRQPKREDNSTGRVQKFRDEKRNVTQCNAEPDAETLDKDTDKEKEKNSNSDDDLASLVSAYEQDIGTVSHSVGEELKADLSTYGLAMLLEAIKESVRNNVRKWSYVHAIAENWRVNGRGKSNGGKPKRNGGKSNLLAGQY